MDFPLHKERMLAKYMDVMVLANMLCYFSIKVSFFFRDSMGNCSCIMKQNMASLEQRTLLSRILKEHVIELSQGVITRTLTPVYKRRIMCVLFGANSSHNLWKNSTPLRDISTICRVTFSAYNVKFHQRLAKAKLSSCN